MARARAKGAELQKVLDELSALNEKLASLRSYRLVGIFQRESRLMSLVDCSDCRKYGSYGSGVCMELGRTVGWELGWDECPRSVRLEQLLPTFVCT